MPLFATTATKLTKTVALKPFNRMINVFKHDLLNIMPTHITRLESVKDNLSQTNTINAAQMILGPFYGHAGMAKL
uniref:Uncharacterized protein n=1 Tax=Rhizophora mucronata TaxID=61149 RepID=A0A2P2KQ20_RHIMU